MNRFVIDASYVLAFLLPDEHQDQVDDLFSKYTSGDVYFVAPTLLPYEVANALSASIKRKRITKIQAQNLLEAFLDFSFPLLSIQFKQALSLSQKYQISLYDASYLVLSQTLQYPLLTFDKQLKSFISL